MFLPGAVQQLKILRSLIWHPRADFRPHSDSLRADKGGNCDPEWIKA